MKLYIIALCLSLATSITLGQTKNYTINSVLANVKDGTKFYLVSNPIKNGKVIRDTINIATSKNGRFTMIGKMPEGQLELYWLFNEIVPAELPMIVNKGKTSIEGDFSTWPKIQVSGSIENNEFQLMREPILSTSLFIKELTKEMASVNSKVDSAKYNKLNEQLKDMVNKTFPNLISSVIKEHPNSIYSALLLSKRAPGTAKEKLKIFEGFTPFVKNSRYGKECLQVLNYAISSEKIKLGGLLPDFFINDFENKQVSILSLIAKNKVTLIDFWASWCSPCRTNIPKLKAIYDKFKNEGFNIIGLAFKDSEKSWKKALSEENMAWENVNDKNDIGTKLFGLTSIPAYMLVDHSGRIISLNLLSEYIKYGGPSLQPSDLEKTIEEQLKQVSQGNKF